MPLPDQRKGANRAPFRVYSAAELASARRAQSGFARTVEFGDTFAVVESGDIANLSGRLLDLLAVVLGKAGFQRGHESLLKILLKGRIAALKPVSKCSHMSSMQRFLGQFCLALHS